MAIVNSYKYLGMVFSTKLSLGYMWGETCRKGQKGVIEILKSLRRLNCIDPHMFWKLFDIQIVPLLTYASEVWGLSSNLQIEKVHTYAIKRFLKVPIHSSNTVLYGETGRYPLYIKTCIKSVKYWLKIIKLPRARICKQAYLMMLSQLDLNRENWAFSVKKVLSEHGFGIVWISQEVGSERQFISELRDRLICSFKQNWHWNMENNSK